MKSVIESELTEPFWNVLLPQRMETSSVNSQYFLAFQAAQVKAKDKGQIVIDFDTNDDFERILGLLGK